MDPNQPYAEPFVPPYAVQLQGYRLAAWILKLWGWRVDFAGLPTRQGILAVYPHTSNWDFVVLVLAKWSVGIEAKFWAKDSLFRWPLVGRWFRWLGGVPVNRNSANGTVGDMVQSMQSCKRDGEMCWLALAPEGTRKHTPGWRSGFYQVAVRAQVPVALVQLDFGRKCVVVRDFLMMSGNVASDMVRVAPIFDGVLGCKPDKASPIQLISR